MPVKRTLTPLRTQHGNPHLESEAGTALYHSSVVTCAASLRLQWPMQMHMCQSRTLPANV